MQTVIITGETLTLDELAAVCRFHAPVELDKEAMERIRASRKIIDDFVEREEVVYGVTTGSANSVMWSYPKKTVCSFRKMSL